jgi:hypothetical protein
MKKTLYSIVYSLLVFVFIQCNSSPTQQNTTVPHQWKDSLIIDMFSAGFESYQMDTAFTSTLSAQGQAMFKPTGLILHDYFRYAVPKYVPSFFEAWLFIRGNIFSSDTLPPTNLLFSTINDNTTQYYSLRKNENYEQISFRIGYTYGLGFRYSDQGLIGEMKIYYE